MSRLAAAQLATPADAALFVAALEAAFLGPAPDRAGGATISEGGVGHRGAGLGGWAQGLPGQAVVDLAGFDNDAKDAIKALLTALTAKRELFAEADDAAAAAASEADLRVRVEGLPALAGECPASASTERQLGLLDALYLGFVVRAALKTDDTCEPTRDTLCSVLIPSPPSRIANLG